MVRCAKIRRFAPYIGFWKHCALATLPNHLLPTLQNHPLQNIPQPNSPLPNRHCQIFIVKSYTNQSIPVWVHSNQTKGILLILVINTRTKLNPGSNFVVKKIIMTFFWLHWRGCEKSAWIIFASFSDFFGSFLEIAKNITNRFSSKYHAHNRVKILYMLAKTRSLYPCAFFLEGVTIQRHSRRRMITYKGLASPVLKNHN